MRDILIDPYGRNHLNGEKAQPDGLTFLAAFQFMDMAVCLDENCYLDTDALVAGRLDIWTDVAGLALVARATLDVADDPRTAVTDLLAALWQKRFLGYCGVVRHGYLSRAEGDRLDAMMKAFYDALPPVPEPAVNAYKRRQSAAGQKCQPDPAVVAATQRIRDCLDALSDAVRARLLLDLSGTGVPVPHAMTLTCEVLDADIAGPNIRMSVEEGDLPGSNTVPLPEVILGMVGCVRHRVDQLALRDGGVER